jgi:hypothetical protein
MRLGLKKYVEVAAALLPALIIVLGVVLPFIILARIVVLSVRNA